MHRALEALYILEGYRVLLLQRPPHLYPSVRESLPPAQTGGLSDVLTGLSLPGFPTPSTSLSQILFVSALTILSWPTIPREGIGLQGALWSSEFVELALSRVRHSLHVENDVDALSLYFFTNISLNSDLRLIQRFARETIDTEQRANFSDNILQILRGWTSSDECRVSLYHAKALVELATTTFYRPGAKDQVDPLVWVIPEMPHVPYGVFSSCLVLWCYRTLSAKPVDSIVPTTIDKGLGLLQSSKVHISKVFFRIVSRLKSSDPVHTWYLDNCLIEFTRSPLAWWRTIWSRTGFRWSIIPSPVHPNNPKKPGTQM